MQLLTITMVNMLICDWFVVSAGKLCRFTFILSFVIEGFNASLAHVQTESCWAAANIEAPLWEYIISEPSYYSGTLLTSNVSIYTSPDILSHYELN